ncbi:MAG: GTP cyclohydrolase II [Deltaproteobacteria bacterium]|nr:MAG: GTP cyclohydrolase II [Deltaproteobacteria bacterium]
MASRRVFMDQVRTQDLPDLGNGRLVRLAAEASMPSRFGEFRVVAFESVDGKEYGAVVKGEVRGERGVPVRLHSECFTGDLMGSYRCDCRDQLEAALEFIGQAERGAVLYLRQEGRGIGLANKIRAYALQDAGLDTVEANLALGFEDDQRTYDIAAQMLEELGIVSVQLLTNNPKKWEGLLRHGIDVEGRVPHQMEPNEHNVDYLRTKKEKSGHLL